MKRIFLAVTFLATTFSFSQEFSIGGKVGLNLNSLSGDVANPKMTTGFHAGAMAELKLSDAFSIQPELLYSMQGGEVSRNIDFLKATVKETIMSNYISLPIMGKFYITEGVSIEAGPQIGFLVSSRSNTTASTYGIAVISRAADIKVRSSTLDFGMGAGLSYKMDSGISFGARYNLGLSNFNKGEAITIKSIDDVVVGAMLGNGTVNNTTIQVSIGYFF